MNSIQKARNPFTQILNELLYDSRISFKAKGLFAFMHSKPDDWNFTLKSISTQQNEGIASIRSGMDELKEHGYIKYDKLQSGKGVYSLFQSPKLENPKLENPDVDNRTMQKPNRISNKDIPSNKDISNKDLYLKNKQKEIQLPENTNVDALNMWVEYKGSSYTVQGKKLSANKLAKYPRDIQMAMVESSILNNYKGLFEIKQIGTTIQNNNISTNTNSNIDDVLKIYIEERGKGTDRTYAIAKCKEMLHWDKKRDFEMLATKCDIRIQNESGVSMDDMLRGANPYNFTPRKKSS